MDNCKIIINLKEICETRLLHLSMLNRNALSENELKLVKEEIEHLNYMINMINNINNKVLLDTDGK